MTGKSPRSTWLMNRNTLVEESPVRVLMVFTILNRGGAETMVMNYFRRMDRNRVVFDFLVHRQERGAYENEIEHLGGKIFRLPPLNPLRMGLYKRAVSDFFEVHPEYRLVHGHCSELGYFIYKEAHKRGFDFIAAHAHNTPKGFDLKTPVRNALKHLIRPYLTHRFTCGEESARWFFGKRLAKGAIFLPNAVDARSFAFDRVKREEIRSRNGWDGRLVIGNISRFSRQKNHIFLIDIFACVLRKDPSALLILVGSGGNMESKVREKISRLGIGNSVVFMGSRSDIPDLLQGMDVFLFPSKFEGLSVAQLEAQAAGIKIVNSTAIPKEGTIIPELVDSLTLKHSAEEWAESVLRAKDHERRNRVREIVESGFDIDNNSKWLQNFYLAQSRH